MLRSLFREIWIEPSKSKFNSLLPEINNIDLLRARDRDGTTLLWDVARISQFKEFENVFTEIFRKFPALTLADFRQTQTKGPQRGRSVLWWLAFAASCDLEPNPKPLGLFWEKFGAEISHEDLQVTAADSHSKGISVKGLIMKASLRPEFSTYCSSIKRFPLPPPARLTEKKILLASALDFTQFLPHKKGIVWIGSKDFWLKLYSDITEMALKQNVQVVFAIVSGKRAIDDIVTTAIQTFRPFLEKHNPLLFIDTQKEWCLIDVDGKLDYVLLATDGKIKCSFVPENTISTIMVRYKMIKSDEVKKMASHLGIPLNLSLLLDDNPETIDDAVSEGIHAVSSECFNRDLVGDDKLDDDGYINTNLDRIRTKLMEKCQHLIECAANQSMEQKLIEKLEVMKLSDVPPLRFSTLPVEQSLSTESASKRSPHA